MRRGYAVAKRALSTWEKRAETLVSDSGISFGEKGPRNILIVSKINDVDCQSFSDTLIRHLLQYTDTHLFIEGESTDEVNSRVHHIGSDVDLSPYIDMCITLGGDGTILHVNKLFQSYVPPVMSFSMGSLGFLMSFQRDNYRDAIERLFTQASLPYTSRTRLNCRHNDDADSFTVINEVTVHRGGASQLLNIDIHVQDTLLTRSKGDGLIVATPTGSTAYSVSSGGSMVHPSIQAILLTPVAPRSLSFRPLVLPPHISLRLSWSPQSEDEKSAIAFFDGNRQVKELSPGDQLEITLSEYPLMSLCDVNPTDDWVNDINRQLKWNQVGALFYDQNPLFNS